MAAVGGTVSGFTGEFCDTSNVTMMASLDGYMAEWLARRNAVEEQLGLTIHTNN